MRLTTGHDITAKQNISKKKNATGGNRNDKYIHTHRSTHLKGNTVMYNS